MFKFLGYLLLLLVALPVVCTICAGGSRSDKKRVPLSEVYQVPSAPKNETAEPLAPIAATQQHVLSAAWPCLYR